jgi:hypothetical protein
VVDLHLKKKAKKMKKKKMRKKKMRKKKMVMMKVQNFLAAYFVTQH